MLGVFGGIFHFIQILIEHSVIHSGDPDQTPRFAASDQSLRCVPMSHKKDSRLIWVKLEKLWVIFRGRNDCYFKCFQMLLYAKTHCFGSIVPLCFTHCSSWGKEINSQRGFYNNAKRQITDFRSMGH